MKNKQTPDIRFMEFTEDWEQRRLEDVFNVLDGDRGKNYPGESDFYENGATLFLDTGNVKKNGFDFSTKKYITKEKDESLRSGKLELHDFVLTSRGTLGNVAYYDEKTRNNHPSVRINSAMLILRPAMSNQVSDDYMAAVLRGNIIDTFMSTNHVGSAQPHITKRDFSKVSVGIPSTLEEQTKIGSFFKKIDETIALYQQELTTLKQTKQGFLQKMFPKEGESVPEVRFPRFTGDWNQCKFEDFTKLSQGLQIAIDKRYTEPGDNKLFYITNEFLNPKSDKKYFIEEPPKSVIAKKDDILMTRTGNTGKVVTDVEGAFHNNFFKIAYVEKETSKLFLYYLLTSISIQKEIIARAGASTIPDLNHNDFYKIKVALPSKSEQTIIGSFFKQLDDTIALHQRELDALKETKKAFLQKMFV